MRVQFIVAASLSLWPINYFSPAAETTSRVSSQALPAECQRDRARRWSAGEVWTIPVSAGRCAFEVQKGSVVLVPDGVRVGEIGQMVVQDSAGQFLTHERAGAVAVWSPLGRLKHVFGRSGSGPGEFAPGPLNIAPLRRGGYYVFDNQGRWHLFDAQLRHVRTSQFTAFKSPYETAVLDDGRVLDASGRESGANFFGVWSPMHPSGDARPSMQARFAPVPPTEMSFSRADRVRRLAYAGGDRFWASPPVATGRGYVLEQWNIDGTRLRTLRRAVPWYPEGADRASRLRGAVVPPHEIESLWDLGDELLLIILLAPKEAEWTRLGGSTPDAATRDRMVDVWAEVLDTRSGTVVAQRGPLRYSQAVNMLPRGIFNGSRDGYLFEQNADDERVARLLHLKLTSK